MASARPQTPTQRSTGATITSPGLLDNLLTTADADSDAATAPILADLSLTELVAPGQAKSSKSAGPRPSLKGRSRGARPSWGPTPAGLGKDSRLLQGLGEIPSDSLEEGSSTAGDKSAIGSSSAGSKGAGGRLGPSAGVAGRSKDGRPRFSLFTRKSLAPSQLGRPSGITEVDESKALPRLSEGEAAADQSTAPLTEELPAAPPSASLADENKKAQAPPPEPSTAADASDPSSIDEAALRASAARERDDALKRHLLEVRRMNEVFEGYESMLMSSAEQIDQFATRVKITDTLLDSYIALLRDSSRTQELLLSAEWKGASADSAEAHALAVALAQRETERVRQMEEQRRREAEVERRRREAELRERERAREEEERRAALVASSAGVGRSGVRSSTAARGGGAAAGARRGGAARGGAASASAAAAGRAAAGGARPPVAGHTRGASAATRGGAGAAASSGGSRLGRPSSIPRPPSAGGV
ncbi:hypothetical protein V8E36_000348 [Tilletia maclaganii]